MSNGILRKHHYKRNFTILDNTTPQNHALSLRARGLLWFLLSHKDGYPVNATEIARLLADARVDDATTIREGRDAVEAAIKELTFYGYMRRHREQNSLGHWITYTEVFEGPELAEDTLTDDGSPVAGDEPADDGSPVVGETRRSEHITAGRTDDGSTDIGSPVAKGRTSKSKDKSKGQRLGADAPVGQEPDQHLSLFDGSKSSVPSAGNRGSSTPPTPPPPPPGQNGHKSATAETVQTVFEAWRVAAGKNGTTKLTDARRRKICARLREGYPVEEVLLAVTEGWKRDPWPERARYNDLVTLLRDGPQLEKFRDLALGGTDGDAGPAAARGGTPSGNGQGPSGAEATADQDESDAATLAAGAEYNRRQAALRVEATTTEFGRRLAAEAAQAAQRSAGGAG